MAPPLSILLYEAARRATSRILTLEVRSQARSNPPWFGLLGRLVALAVLFTLELIALSAQLDTADLSGQVGLTGLIGDWGPTLLQAVVAFAALFFTFGLITARSAFKRISRELGPVSWRLLSAHVCAILSFVALSHILFGHTPKNWQADLIAAVWLSTGLFAIMFAGIALVPPKLALKVLHDSGSIWVFAAFGSIIACLVGDMARFVWKPAISLTFEFVQVLLRPFISDLIVSPATMAIGSHRFQVTISRGCSGLEGAGLMLVFSVAWIWFFRRECRFPQALLLIPVGILLVWCLNAVRIAALILIGNAGAESVAMGGFHSQAGWIAFNAVALGFTVASYRVPWLTTKVPQTRAVEDRGAENRTAWYLTPFLMILAAAMVARAAADGFEWLYPLRFFAAAAALLYFRRKYADLDWRIGWAAPVAGGIVFVMWLGLDHMIGTNSQNLVGAGLASLSPSARVTWIVFRTLAATVTVPIAEELAFRGFLLRRLISPDFDEVRSGSFTLLSVLVSSIAFGILHGDRWVAGTFAGALYALAFRQRGRIGDAVVAHTITNALLTACVLLTGNWQLW